MELDADIIIIGGGLAGLTSAIHLSKVGLKVTVIEKSSYPQHKVCGEYISNEVLPYLNWLGINIADLAPTNITNFQFTSVNGKQLQARLPLGGFGISRFTLDQFLYQKAIQNGCEVIHDTVISADFEEDYFIVTTQNNSYTARFAIGAYGKRSTLDQKMNRDFIQQKSGWLAVKAHYKGNFPENTVALHHFKGGYCGVSAVENKQLNICYLVNYPSFKAYKNIAEHQENVLYQNIHLKEILVHSDMLFEAPLTISQINFNAKERVKNHILMVGDTAGLIHPLCGNGMSMAIHSAKIVATLLIAYFNGEINTRHELENTYDKQWKQQFSSRLATGRLLAKALSYDGLANVLMNGLGKLPQLLPYIIKKTHGKPIPIN